MNERGPCGARSGANIAVAVLAAGLGERFGGDLPKPLLTLGGQPLLFHALRAAREHTGGPLLVDGTDTLVGVSSFVIDDLCRGAAFATRVDTADELDFVNGFL